MADLCVFCGKELGRFGQRELYCENIRQPACRDCFEELTQLPQEEWCRRALEGGRANQPEAIRAGLEKRRAAQEEERQRRLTGKSCLRCGGPMLRHGVQHIQVGEKGALMNAVTRTLPVDILYCPGCGKVEFFLPPGQDELKVSWPGDKLFPGELRPEPAVRCAACGQKRSAQFKKCLACGGEAIAEEPSAPAKEKKEKKRPEKKPPWEK